MFRFSADAATETDLFGLSAPMLEFLVVLSTMLLVVVSGALTLVTWYAIEERNRRMIAKVVRFQFREARKLRAEMRAEMEAHEKALEGRLDEHAKALVESAICTEDTYVHGAHAVILTLPKRD